MRKLSVVVVPDLLFITMDYFVTLAPRNDWAQKRLAWRHCEKSQDFCGNPFCYPPAFVTFAKLKNDCDLPNYGGRAPSLVREGWEGY